MQVFRKAFIFFFTIMMCCTKISAQNYIYPVATGTSWAINVFENAEKTEYLKNANQKPLDNAPDFADSFTRIYRNYIEHQQYDDSIFVDMPHQEWIAMFMRRAKRYSEIYNENNSLHREMKGYFGDEAVPDAAYDSLYFWVRHLYHNNMNDVFMLEQLVDNILIPHYEQKNDLEHLMFCYSCAGLVHYQCNRIGDEEDAKKSLENYHKAIAMSDRFAKFEDPLNRYYFISSYVNLCVLHAQDGRVSMEESRKLLKKMQDIFNEEEVKAIFEKDNDLKEFAGWALRLYCLRSIMTYISHNMNDIFLFGDLYSAYISTRSEFNENFTNQKYRYYAKLPYDDLIIEAYIGNISWDKAYEKFTATLDNDPDLKPDKRLSNYRLNYMNNLFASHLFLIERTTMSAAEKKVAVKEMLDHVLDVVEHFEHLQFPFEKGQIIHNIATHPDIMKYLTTNEKENLIYRLLVLEQPTMYVHVSMVADLTRILTEALIDKKPEYFATIPNLGTPEQLRQHKEELLDFIYNAALFHDVGKFSMPTIVNNNYRSLTNHEFQIVKMHPEKALPFFAIDESFGRYTEIALGHHKWYNGENYPTGFDNKASSIYPLINIVAICDCMDAATENVGRNYHTPRQFENLMAEFSADSGTRYDPEIIEFINQNSDLFAQLKQKVLAGRMQHYYKMYRSYLQK